MNRTMRVKRTNRGKCTNRGKPTKMGEIERGKYFQFWLEETRYQYWEIDRNIISVLVHVTSIGK